MGIRALAAVTAIGGACVLAGCGAADVETAAPETSAAGASASSSASRTTPSAPESAPLHPDSGALPERWPTEAALVPGADVWAVYLAIGPRGDPALAEAAAYLEDRGYSTYPGRELGCDAGAVQALGRDDQERAVAVYFDWRADAGDFLTLTASDGKQNAGPFVDLVRVTLECSA